MLIDASDLFKGTLEGRLEMRLAACATTPVTISLKELRGCARMIVANLAFVLDELTDARWPNRRFCSGLI